MVTTAPPQYGTVRAKIERQIRRRDLAAWTVHIVLGVAILVNPPISIQTTIGDGSPLQAILGGFFAVGGLIGVVVRLRGRYRAEKLAFTLSRFGLLMYLVVLLFASGVGYPSSVGLAIVVLLFIYLDKQRLEVKVLEHAAGSEQPHD